MPAFLPVSRGHLDTLQLRGGLCISLSTSHCRDPVALSQLLVWSPFCFPCWDVGPLRTEITSPGSVSTALTHGSRHLVFGQKLQFLLRLSHFCCPSFFLGSSYHWGSKGKPKAADQQGQRRGRSGPTPRPGPEHGCPAQQESRLLTLWKQHTAHPTHSWAPSSHIWAGRGAGDFQRLH